MTDDSAETEAFVSGHRVCGVADTGFAAQRTQGLRRSRQRPLRGVIQSDAGPIIPDGLLIVFKESPMFMTDRDQTLIERLDRHPLLRTRVESLLVVVENAMGVSGHMIYGVAVT